MSTVLAAMVTRRVGCTDLYYWSFVYRLCNKERASNTCRSKRLFPTISVMDRPALTPKFGSKAGVEGGLHMSKGDQDDSYSKNSEVQKLLIERSVIPNLDETLAHLYLPANDKPVILADLGCSSGPNAIWLMSHFVEKIKERFASCDKSSLEFQAFFNDLPSNDFNNLFHLLSSGGAKSSSFFSAGVPGSFFEPLFPQSKVNIFISTIALHYVAKLPASVIDKESASFNKGTWWALGSGSNKEAVNAFKDQHTKDIDTFLRLRAKELVPGGLLCFATFTRWNPGSSRVETSMETIARCTDNALKELIKRGIVSEDHADVFNVPMYFQTSGDLEELIHKHHSILELIMFKEVKVKPFVGVDTGDNQRSSHVIQSSTGIMRGAFGGIVGRQIGEEAAKLLLESLERGNSQC